MDKRQTRAFEGFAAESGAELLRIATVLTSDPHTAEDVYQETLQRLAARWPRVDNPKAFCRRVMYNIVVDQMRARARRPRELRLHDAGERSDPRAADRHDSVELWPTLRTALDSLTVQQRTVIALRYLDDCSEAETAKLLGISVGTVKSTAGTRPRCPSPACPPRARPVPLTWPPPAPPGCPDQLWPDWAVRLTGDGTSSSHDKFLPAALIALLLPHSSMPLNQVTAMVSSQLRQHITGYHMSRLTTEALRILTELAFAIDDRHIPVDYQRRRDLAAAATLIGDATWARMTRQAGVRLPPVASARRYLYELLTGCSLVTAPPPYRLSAGPLARYNNFAIGMPASLAAALDSHARRLLDRWGAGDEPLHWQPPDDWVTAAAWPGPDPARTNPAPIHHALLNEDATPAQIAADLGISLGHLRQVLRRHPLPAPAARSAAPSSPRPSRPPGPPASSPA